MRWKNIQCFASSKWEILEHLISWCATDDHDVSKHRLAILRYPSWDETGYAPHLAVNLFISPTHCVYPANPATCNIISRTQTDKIGAKLMYEPEENGTNKSFFHEFTVNFHESKSFSRSTLLFTVLFIYPANVPDWWQWPACQKEVSPVHVPCTIHHSTGLSLLTPYPTTHVWPKYRSAITTFLCTFN